MSRLRVPLLDLAGITKQFGQVIANNSVNFQVRSGEIIGLLGENGAGKTTLMNVAFGLYRPDAGSIKVKGQTVDIGSPADAMSFGIGMVHQHAHVVDRHSVLENVIAGLPGRNGFLDKQAAIRRLEEIRSRYGLYLSPERLVADLAVGEKQRLDIIRVLFRESRVVILDEPTSVLTPKESEGLFDAVRALASDGLGVVLISHKLNDVRAVTSRVVVMRGGAVVAEVENDGQLSNSQLATLMCGHEPERVMRQPSQAGSARLEMKELVLVDQWRPGHRPAAFDLTVSSGEIVGIAGVSGNGQVSLAETLAGLRHAAAGVVRTDGKEFRASGPKIGPETGVAYIPEDRIGAGFAGSLSAAENMVLSRFRQPPFSRHGWLNQTAISQFATSLFGRYDIRPPDPKTRMTLFSGGNQQKAIVAREIALSPRVLIIAQPTRGLDVAAASFIHRQLIELKTQGCAIVMISEDLDELFQLSDRIAVIYDGAIVLDQASEFLTIAEVGLAMSGSANARDAA